MSASGGNASSTPYPAGATFRSSGSAQMANAPAVANMGAVVGKTNYVTGFEVTGSGATAGSIVDVTITGLLGTTLHYALTVPTGVLLEVDPLIVEFTYPLPASGPNIGVTATCPALGVGSTNAAVCLHGYTV